MSASLIAAAKRLFKRFHGYDAAPEDVVELPPTDKEIALYVGELSSVIYIADGQEYIHDFDKNDRPGLYVSSDGQQAYIVAGRYVFTERGFVK